MRGNPASVPAGGLFRKPWLTCFRLAWLAIGLVCNPLQVNLLRKLLLTNHALK